MTKYKIATCLSTEWGEIVTCTFVPADGGGELTFDEQDAADSYADYLMMQYPEQKFWVMAMEEAEANMNLKGEKS